MADSTLKAHATRERRTAQRDAIQHVLEHAAGPLSPQQILTEAHAKAPGLGIATVYRAIKDLCDENAVDAVCLADGALRYELHKSDHHHHFYCRGCDLVYDVTAHCDAMDADLPDGFVVDRHEVLIFGVCSTCRRSKHRRNARL